LIHSIIDEALLCHVAFSIDGQAHVLPTAHARLGDTIILHGAIANRMLGAVLSNASCCITFTLLDGLVLARSAYHHSMNYRCVVVYGEAVELTDDAAKRVALDRLVDHVAPGRAREAREPNREELRATRVVSVRIDEASAKVRRGPVVDDPEDVSADGVWAGVLPVALRAGTPQRDVDCRTLLAPDGAVALRAQALEGERVYEDHDLGLCFSTDRTRQDLSFIHQALTESYWAQGVTFERVRTSFENSLCFGAYAANGEQVACARVIADGARVGYLADVFVTPSQRGRGIGQRLVRFVLAHPQVAVIERLLLRTRDAQDLYARLGFVASGTDITSMALLQNSH
jgi:nitroimidazol reductase NimA-like FMN-containing flavoprotein (pyridoxamine 5'-phosphate oxidase superfamily)/N-acetylglutamate synthase-like GNAT family acetyltransferase